MMLAGIELITFQLQTRSPNHKTMALCLMKKKLTNNLISFFSLGIFISKRPFKVIAATLAVVFVCSFGIVQFYEEKNMVKLWIPQDIDFSKNYHWLMKNFPPDIRYFTLTFQHCLLKIRYNDI